VVAGGDLDGDGTTDVVIGNGFQTIAVFNRLLE